MRISDWSSDVCSSDLCEGSSSSGRATGRCTTACGFTRPTFIARSRQGSSSTLHRDVLQTGFRRGGAASAKDVDPGQHQESRQQRPDVQARHHNRSEEHTSELQSLMRISYAVFCLKKKNTN